MEISTILGLIFGLVAVIWGMILKHAPLHALATPAAYVIILVGTAASIFMAFPFSEVKKIPSLFKMIFVKKKLISKPELITMFMEWASITRREGLLALESKVDEIEDNFLRNGMRMIIDGNDQEFVRDVLMEDIHATEDRHKAGALIFSQAGMYAPTLGVLGAVIGLIAALADMSDMNKLAAAIGAAFIATLLGIFTGYVLWHPIANKLKRLSKREIEVRMMMVEGLLSIQSGVSTIAINQKLAVFLTPSERAKLNDEKESGSGEQKTRHEEHEEHADESWLLPYSDLMTLLVALFIVMYSMSATDAKKFEEMSQAFSSALNGGTGILEERAAMPSKSQEDLGKNDQMDKSVTKKNEEAEMAKLRQKEQEDLEKLKKQFDQYIGKNGLTDLLSTKLNQSQLMITISDNALFASGQAVVKDESRQLAKSISTMLQQFPDYDVVVQGHTDNIPISNSDYSSNWDLSADRALQFMKILLTNTNLNPRKFSAIGYGEYHPISENTTAVGRSKNRRVEVSIIRKYQETKEFSGIAPTDE